MASTSNINATSVSTLCVEKVPSEMHALLHKTASVWQRIAQEKTMQALREGEDPKLFRESSCVNAWIAQTLEGPVYQRPLPSCNEVYVCTDSQGAYQGICVVVFEEEATCIDWLTTHPHNLRSPVNSTEAQRVTGVGTALMQYVEKQAVQRGYNKIYLRPTQTAISFYERLAFQSEQGLKMSKILKAS
jgi:GNAT superfamily N-acetyltransferase